MTIDFLGIINSWQLTRLPKTFDFRYSLSKGETRQPFNSLKSAIEYANLN